MRQVKGNVGTCLLKRCCFAGIRCPYLDGFCYCGRNPVDGNAGGDALRLEACAIKYNGERYKGCSCREGFLIILVEQLPSWSDFYDEVTTDGRAVRTLHYTAHSGNLD